MQALLIFLIIILGVIFPYGEPYTWVIRPSLMLMLFFAFLGMDYNRGVVRKDHFIVLVLNLLIPIILYLAIRPFNGLVAQCVFIVGIAPTAAGAPVFADFLRTRVESVTASVLITSPIIAVALPFLLSILIQVETKINLIDILMPIGIVIFVPLIISLLVRWSMPRQYPIILSYKRLSFYLFLLNLYVAASKASIFIRGNQDTNFETISLIFVSIIALALLNFTVGQRIGKKEWGLANSLSLGRKNTMFAIWVSLTFLNPAVALGPMFYILAQNGYNGWQLYLQNKDRKNDS